MFLTENLQTVKKNLLNIVLALKMHYLIKKYIFGQ